MKYCTRCGQQIDDQAVICPKCGCIADEKAFKATNNNGNSTLRAVAKVFMILGCLSYAFFIIPLLWRFL